MKKVSVIVSAAFVLVASIQSSAIAVTFGGEVIDASVSKPWVVSIWHGETSDSDLDFTCSGSLIAPDVVLTAAHCVLANGFFQVQTHADTLRQSTYKFHEVDSTWKSPRYSAKRLINDFGLLKLTEPILDITPVPFAKSSQLKNSDALRSFRLFGWGVNQDGDSANYLGTASLSNQASAASKIFKTSFNSKTMIAAGKYLSTERVYAGACNGDSGGPLVGMISGVETVVGVTSFGRTGCNYRAPSIFTKVAYFAKDIAAGMAAVRKGSVVANRAAPTYLVAPTITGGVGEGQLNCNTGQWSNNTTKVSFKWISPYNVSGIENQQLQISSFVIDRTFTCRVTASTSFTSVYMDITRVIPAPPSSYSYLNIKNLPYIGKTTVGTVLSCGPLTWTSSGVSESVNWYAGNSLFYSSSGSSLIASGSQLIITPEVIASFTGKNYIQCVVSGTNEGGSNAYDTGWSISF